MRCESPLEFLERFLLFGAPFPWCLSRELVERFAQLPEVLDEAAIEVGEASELTHFRGARGCLPIYYRLDFSRIHAHLSMPDNNAQVLGFLDLELALFWFKVEIPFNQSSKYFADHRPMFVEVVGVDQDVIKVDSNFAL